MLFFFQAEDGIRDLVRSRGLGDVYKRQLFFLTQVPIESVALKLFTGIEKFEIMAIPFFILAGNFLTHGGVAKRMIHFATASHAATRECSRGFAPSRRSTTTTPSSSRGGATKESIAPR
mgnify:CR=1 FL=1